MRVKIFQTFKARLKRKSLQIYIIIEHDVKDLLPIQQPVGLFRAQ